MPVIRSPNNDGPPPIDVNQALAQERERRRLELIAEEAARREYLDREAAERRARAPKQFMPLTELTDEPGAAARAKIQHALETVCRELKLDPVRERLPESRYFVASDSSIEMTVQRFHEGRVVTDRMPLDDGMRLLLDIARSPERRIDDDRRAWQAAQAKAKQDREDAQALTEWRRAYFEKTGTYVKQIMALDPATRVAMILAHEFSDQKAASVPMLLERMRDLLLERPEQAKETTDEFVTAMVRPTNMRPNGFDIVDNLKALLNPTRNGE